MATAKKIPLVVISVLLAGCKCQLSGTPLDVMEKRFNPGCWVVASSDDAAPEPPPVTPAP